MNNKPYLMPKACNIIDVFNSAKGIKTFILDIKNLSSKPGQFITLWIPEVDEKPFSIARDTGDELWLTIAKVGEFTEKLFSMKKGDKLGIRGPFGKGFKIESNKNIILVGGGFGTAPLHFLATEHQKKSSKVQMLIGSRSAENLVFEKECSESNIPTFVSTDDGTKGHKGFITEVLEEKLKKEKIDLVQCCGPELMMKRVAEICRDADVNSEVSVERYMKCGFGVCGQCVMNGKRMCIDGPVVSGVFALSQSEFGKFYRGSEGQKIEF